MKDLNEELIDFLKYVEHSDSKTAEESKGSLVKNIHKKVIEVKNNANVEVEFMTLLERDREKIEEGRQEGRQDGRQEEKLEIAKNMIKLGIDIDTIIKATGLSKEIIEKLNIK